MLKERESAKIIERQGEAIIKMNYRITELQEELKLKNIKIKNKKAVISELIEENVEMYAELKQTRIEKEEIEIRETDMARKLKIIEDLIQNFDVKLFEQLKNVLVSDHQSKH